MAIVMPYLTESGIECERAYAIVQEAVVTKGDGHLVMYKGAVYANEAAYHDGFRPVQRFREQRFELDLSAEDNIIQQAYLHLKTQPGFEYAEDDLVIDEEE